VKADEKLNPVNIKKAATIHARLELMLLHDISVTPSDIMDRCKSAAELDYWDRIVCKNEFDEVVRV
jgi:hypothetical protein